VTRRIAAEGWFVAFVRISMSQRFWTPAVARRRVVSAKVRVSANAGAGAVETGVGIDATPQPSDCCRRGGE
jgi:hypothetical protein